MCLLGDTQPGLASAALSVQPPLVDASVMPPVQLALSSGSALGSSAATSASFAGQPLQQCKPGHVSAAQTAAVLLPAGSSGGATLSEPGLPASLGKVVAQLSPVAEVATPVFVKKEITMNSEEAFVIMFVCASVCV